MRAIAFLLCLAATAVFAAADYPNKPIKLIVPFAPGGGNDAVARTIAQKISAGLGQQVVVDNRAGAGGVVGAELAAKSPADGYTLFLGGVGSHAINPNLHRDLPYDPVKDFAPVCLIASAPLILVVNPSVPAHTVAELVALARSKPRALNYASNGNGSSSHLAAVMFESMTGAPMTHVPYKGLSPALVDLLSGQVQLMFSSVVAILPHIQSGKLRALAVTGTSRLASLPNVPTVAETGVAGYQATSWYGILAPAGTPREVVMKLNAEINRAVASPEVRNAFAVEGAVPAGGTPEDFGNHIRAEMERLGKVIRDAKLQVRD
ncbi:MAG TPA: tripartite tricarboxylate transporter substrate binding protein [Usitatibacter sp.]|nr:tripartite tricarboxylate transporter substrate binding protein [Usitatibacter sp.]